MIAAPQDFLDATRPYLPHFRFVLDDWSALTFEQLALPVLHPMVRLAQLALASSDSAARRRQAFHHIQAIWRGLDDDERTRAWRACFFRYMFRTAPTGMSAREIHRMMCEAVTPKQAEEVMNAAQELIQEGRVETLRSAIADVLSARSMPLSEQGSARVAACADAEILNTWHRRAVTAQSEDDVFART